MFDFIDFSANIQITFGIVMIIGLLIYIAFFKDKANESSKHPRRR